MSFGIAIIVVLNFLKIVSSFKIHFWSFEYRKVANVTLNSNLCHKCSLSLWSLKYKWKIYVWKKCKEQIWNNGSSLRLKKSVNYFLRMKVLCCLMFNYYFIFIESIHIHIIRLLNIGFILLRTCPLFTVSLWYNKKKKELFISSRQIFWMTMKISKWLDMNHNHTN